MTKLLFGIGEFGSNILEHILRRKTALILNDSHELLLLTNNIPHNDIPYIFINNHGAIQQSSSQINDYSDLKNEINKYKKITLFVGIGGSFTHEVFHELLATNIVDKSKLYIVAVSPFSFEDRETASLAKATLKTIIDSKIACSVCLQIMKL